MLDGPPGLSACVDQWPIHGMHVLVGMLCFVQDQRITYLVIPVVLSQLERLVPSDDCFVGLGNVAG